MQYKAPRFIKTGVAFQTNIAHQRKHGFSTGRRAWRSSYETCFQTINHQGDAACLVENVFKGSPKTRFSN